jgi:cytochrome c-type biogenesis protein CcmH
VASAGYWWTGAPGEIGQTPAAFGAAASAEAPEGGASAPHATGGEQMAAMVDKLAARMKERPDDADGWAMLGRSYMALGRHDDAVKAYATALKLRPDDATLLADVADVTAVKNGRSLDGEPTKLLERALKIEPDNLKALALAGTAAFNRGDFAAAVKFWDHAIAVGPADSPMVEMSRGGAAEARERGKLPPAAAGTAAAATPAAPAAMPAAPAAVATTAPPAPAAAAGGGDVTGTVRLSAAMKAQAGPEDTVFIFARPAEGSRMPLAIIRKQVKDLPTEFKLDDSLAMSPAARISAAGRVIVGARVSKSGQAMPQPGDLEGLSAPVAVGSHGVVVEIGTKVP